MTIFLIVAPVAVFCVFVARKMVDDFAGDWGWSIMVVAVVFTVYVSVCFLLLLPLTTLFLKYSFMAILAFSIAR